jgi:hypothetical protein
LSWVELVGGKSLTICLPLFHHMLPKWFFK